MGPFGSEKDKTVHGGRGFSAASTKRGRNMGEKKKTKAPQEKGVGEGERGV